MHTSHAVLAEVNAMNPMVLWDEEKMRLSEKELYLHGSAVCWNWQGFDVSTLHWK